MQKVQRAVNKAEYFSRIQYKPYPLQQQFHASKARFKVVVAGRRAGKSVSAARDMEPELLIPNRRYWIVAPVYDLGEREFRVIWNDMIVGLGLGKDRRIKKAFNKSQGNMFIEFPWGTRVEVRTSQNPDHLVGEGLHGVIMSEAAKLHEDTWERFIRPALADFHGWATFSSTPHGQNYLYKLWKFGRDPSPELSEYAAWRHPSWANPYVYPGGREDPEIKLLELTTSKEWFDQEIGADFTTFAGRIYYEFLEDKHVTEVKYNPNLPSYVAFDFGWSNPFTAIEFQVDAWDNIYVWREYYQSHMTIPDHVAQMNAREQPPGYRPPSLGFGDAADPEAAAQLTQLGFCPVVTDSKAKENWREGIELVKMFLKEYETGRELDEFGTPEQKPKMFLDHSCKQLVQEFNNYEALAPSRNSSMGRSPKEAPKKEYDHGLDALRYGLMHLYKLGAQHHLTETMSARDIAPSQVATLANAESGIQPLPNTTGSSTSYFNTGMEF